MPLSVGDRLGRYEILALIGAGGMGQVYRARDPRLNRDVAIKVSAAQFSERFEREAKAIAALNHPNICTLYDVGPNYLVMEFIEGESPKGPMPLDEALRIARQIADALEAAHEKGITHRDLKPANVKIKPDGTVKVLDFGLAKVGCAAGATSENSPTLTIGMTEVGMILGTAAYMSPEQAKGKPVDKRSDIWAFGVVLYEMLTGEQLHKGETLSETLASVLKEQPDLSRVPARVRPLLRSCLQKEAKQRLHDIADARLLLEAVEPETPVITKRRTRRIWPAVAALLIMLAVALGVIFFRPPPASAPEVRLQIPQPDGLTFNPGTQAAISPDGHWLAFPAVASDGVSRMYVRSVDSLEVKPLPGSEGIIGVAPPPFWSDDSRFVVFGALGKLKKADVNGTPAQTIADTGQAFLQGGTWSRDNVVLYANPTGNLMQVPAAGGTPVPVTVMMSGENAHRWPQFLPDGRRFLYLRVSGSPERTGIYVGSLDVKPEKQSMQPLMLTDRQAYWVASEAAGKSYLLIQREATLVAQPFDTDAVKLSGTPVPVATDVGSMAPATSGLWSVARTGALVYRSGGNSGFQFTWRDLTGKTVGTLGDPGLYASPAISPDGKRVAFRMTDAQGNWDIWVRDIERGTNTRLTFDPRRDDAPVWSPDGRKIIFAANRGGRMDLYERNADNSGEERLLFKSDQDKIPTSWSRDGRFVLFSSVALKTAGDLWILPLDANLKPFVFLQTEFQEGWGKFSPDGRWIAYAANPSGAYQVYVRPFSSDSHSSSGASGPQWMISTENGVFPQWSGDGKRLFYVGLSGAFMSVDVQAGTSFQTGTPRRLFGSALGPGGYDVMRAVDRFLFVQIPTTDSPPPLTLVLNWTAALKK